jgi:hypothetical protein
MLHSKIDRWYHGEFWYEISEPVISVLPEVSRAFLVDPTSLDDFSVSAVVPLRSSLQVQMKGPLVSKHNMSCSQDDDPGAV